MPFVGQEAGRSRGLEQGCREQGESPLSLSPAARMLLPLDSQIVLIITSQQRALFLGQVEQKSSNCNWKSLLRHLQPFLLLRSRRSSRSLCDWVCFGGLFWNESVSPGSIALYPRVQLVVLGCHQWLWQVFIVFFVERSTIGGLKNIRYNSLPQWFWVLIGRTVVVLSDVSPL